MQNRSHAVMAQRTESADNADNFPTPPWATRALLEHVIADRGPFNGQTCFEPACGAVHMAKPLAEYFGEVRASDAFVYGFGTVSDYLAASIEAGSVDWVVTNPPFRLAEPFIQRSLVVARKGVAILAHRRQPPKDDWVMVDPSTILYGADRWRRCHGGLSHRVERGAAIKMRLR